MKVNQISVTYGELRSTGYPAFSNKRHEVTIGAVLSDTDSPQLVYEKLHDRAKHLVKTAFGDKDIEGQQEMPF